MTDADLDRIEAALALPLPAFYRRFMREYPRWLAARQPAWSDVERWELADDPDAVIRFNAHVSEAAKGEFFDDHPWPTHCFVIGSERDQNWYFLDLSGGSEVVFLFRHAEGAVRPAAKTLAAFPAALVAWRDAVG